MKPEWYVARIKPRSDRRVQEYLRAFECRVLSPMIVVAKRGKVVQESLFPGYVFIHADRESKAWPIIRWAPGVKYFLPESDHTCPLSSATIEKIQGKVEDWNSGGWIQAFEPGDPVAITAGPLSSLNALFQRYIPGKQRCQVLISIMGRPSQVEVPITDLDNLASRGRFAGG